MIAVGAIRTWCRPAAAGAPTSESGVEAWNERIAVLLGQTRAGSFGMRDFAVGTPWLVTANDPANRLANELGSGFRAMMNSTSPR